MESEHEIRGLRFWDGDPTVLLLEADEDRKAMLLERCVPGTRLRSLPEDEQDVVLAPLIRRLWRAPPDDLPFRPLTSMVEAWIDEVMARRERWPDDRIVHDGLAAFRELAAEPTERVVLGTDVHAGNVLRAERHPWLLIDPKPFVGDPAYDATQHLLNCDGRMHEDPTGTIARFADLLGVDPERARRWTFARTAIEASSDPTRWLDVAIRLAT
jgi:streptomycin 6-kinase